MKLTRTSLAAALAFIGFAVISGCGSPSESSAPTSSAASAKADDPALSKAYTEYARAFNSMDPSQVESAVCPQLFASMKQAGASQTPIPGMSQAERQKPDGDIEFAGKILSSAADGDYAAAYVEQKFSVRPNRVETPLVGFLRTGGRWKVCVFDMSKPAPPLPSAVPGATLGPVR